MLTLIRVLLHKKNTKNSSKPSFTLNTYVPGDHRLVAVLGEQVRHELLVHHPARVLPKVLETDRERGHGVVDPLRVLERHVGRQLGEGLQQLAQRQVVLGADGLGVGARQHRDDGREVVGDPLGGGDVAPGAPVDGDTPAGLRLGHVPRGVKSVWSGWNRSRISDSVWNECSAAEAVTTTASADGAAGLSSTEDSTAAIGGAVVALQALARTRAVVDRGVDQRSGVCFDDMQGEQPNFAEL